MIRQACSRSRALRSSSLVSAIFLTWSEVTVPTLVLWGSAEPRGDAGGLLQQDGGGGTLGDELERPVGVDRDLDRDRGPLHLLGPFVELHHELTDVDAVLAQRRADRRGRRRLTAGALELHFRRHHFGHRLRPRFRRIAGLRSVPAWHASSRGVIRSPTRHVGHRPTRTTTQIRSTCQYSRSTGVGRLKMISMTLTRPRPSMTSSTVPSKFSNGPSLILTRSPRSTSIRTLGPRRWSSPPPGGASG